MMPRLNNSVVILSISVLVFVLYLQPSQKSSLPTFPTPSFPDAKQAELVEFTDATHKWGAPPLHQQTSEHISALTETLGSGICAIDVNRDGWIDLFFVGGSGHRRHYGKNTWWQKSAGNRLLLNKRGHHFEDVTTQAGLQKPLWGMGCSVADLDNDGFHDLIVTGIGGIHLFKNNGDITFTDVTDNTGVLKDQWSTGASLGDFNNDGLLDFYVSNYILYEKGARTFERTSGFRTTTDIAFDQTLYDPEPNRLYLNSGNFRFQDIAQKAGVANALGRSLGAKWVDLNDDNWLDLLVINDHNTPNQVFINNQGHSFSRGGEVYAPFEIAGAHDVIINDFNNDSLNDFFMSRGMGHPPVLLNSSKSYNSSTRSTSQTTLTNYTDTAWSSRVAQARLLAFTGWGSVAEDFNNDSYVDLYIANGSILPDIDTHFVSQAQINSLFINNGNGVFFSQPPAVEPQHPLSSRGAIAVDLDNDGMMEIIVTNNNDPLQIFENSGMGNNWLGLVPDVSIHDTELYGAKISIKTDTQTIKRTLRPAQNFLSQGDRRVHIGLGKSSLVNELVLYWRDNTTSIFTDIVPNRYYVIDKTSNTLLPQHYQSASYTHFDESLSGYSENSLIYLARILLSAPTVDPYLDDITVLWRHASTVVRIAILDFIASHWDIRYLSIIRQALDDNAADVRLKAVNLLKQAELEASIAWLIPLLDDENSDVQCAVAEAFRFFFDEEEAVTHRKMLVISPLIRMLEQESSSASICAANALAAAENKRAILPLVELAKHNNDAEVQTAAIRALGLIRDTSAKETLQRLVLNSSSDASVVASGLTALSRLNDPSLDSVFDEAFTHAIQTASPALLVSDRLTTTDEVTEPRTLQTPDSGAPTSSRTYEILNYLFSNPDGIVFPKIKLERVLQEVIARESHDNKLNTIAALNTISEGRISALENTALTFVDSPDQAVSTEALVTLGSLNTPSSRKQFEARLLQESPAIIKTSIERASLHGYRLSDQFLSLLSKQVVKDPELFQASLDILTLLPSNQASKLLGTLLGKNLENNQVHSLLSVCSKHSLLPALPDQMNWSRLTPSTRVQYLDCLLQSRHELEKDSNTQIYNIKMRILVQSVLSDDYLDNETKARVLIKASKVDSLFANTLLVKQLRKLPEELLPLALQALEVSRCNNAPATIALNHQVESKSRDEWEHPCTHGTEEYLWGLLKDRQLSNELRLQAAVLLTYTNRDNVLDYLYQEF